MKMMTDAKPDTKEMLSDLDEEDPSSTVSPSLSITPPPVETGTQNLGEDPKKDNWIKRLAKSLRRNRRQSNLQETLDNFMDDASSDTPSISAHEHRLITNVLKLQDVCAKDVMVPRTDIVAVDVDTPPEEVCQLMAEVQHSRICVYRDNLDEVIGTIHIKDLLPKLVSKEEFDIHELCRAIPIVSPAMPVLDLLLQMRESKKHMVLVIDEYGGIDGLVAIGDIIEDIVGNIDDEYDGDNEPQIIENSDGSVVTDALVQIDVFEEKFGKIFSDEEVEDANTLSGLVSTLVGRVPVRGEIIVHDSGMEFEVLDADLRRINRLRIKNIPSPETPNPENQS